MKNSLHTIIALMVFAFFASSVSYGQSSSKVTTENFGEPTTITLNLSDLPSGCSLQLKEMEKMNDFESVTVDEAAGKVVFKTTRAMTVEQLKANVANYTQSYKQKANTPAEKSTH